MNRSARLVQVALATVVLLTSATPLSGAQPVNAAPVVHADMWDDDFCLNYWLVPCPDSHDFYWRSQTPFSPFRPGAWNSWVSVVAPVDTNYFFEPAPRGLHEAHDYFVVGWGYDWNVVPAAYWQFGDDHSGVGQVFWANLASTVHNYARSSYGQVSLNPSGEPGFVTRSTVWWWGDVWFWYLECTIVPPQCSRVYERLPLVAWQSRRHPVAVRQILPMSVGY